MIPSPRRRRVARNAARAGTGFSAVMLTLSVWASLGPGLRPAVAAENAGTPLIRVPSGLPNSGTALSSGGSATQFALTLPQGAACTGDSASGEFRVQSYMVPATVDPATLTFNADGPEPLGTGADLRVPLFGAGGLPFVQAQTDIAVPGGDGSGNISGIPAFDFSVFGADGPQVVPAGAYNLGIACTKGVPSATQLDRYWNIQFTFAVDAADQPSGITWTVSQVQPTPTTVILAVDPASGAATGALVTLTATVTPATAAGTVTFKDGTTVVGGPETVANGKASTATAGLAAGEHTLTASFAPAAGAAFAASSATAVEYTISGTASTTTTAPTGSTTTTTTAPGASTTTTTAPGAPTTTTTAPGGSTTTTTIAGGGGSPPGGSRGGGPISVSIPVTGGSLSLATWGGLLIIFGRMAVLLGRTPAVLPISAR